MVRVVYLEHTETRHDVDLPAGESLMRGAVSHDIPGIRGDCGGALACATCHVYIGEPWRARLQPPGEYELEMLECAVDRNDDSRLGCQIPVSDALEGIVVRMPRSQT